MRVFTVPIKK